ncbi:MAG: hypothetical protein KJ674_04965 [Nanoarchaeota archaeon]|nr:hypothetical protein [Nanoarchaeota archaeon]
MTTLKINNPGEIFIKLADYYRPTSPTIGTPLAEFALEYGKHFWGKTIPLEIRDQLIEELSNPLTFPEVNRSVVERIVYEHIK